METSELLKKVRRIEIKTKGLSNHIFQGEYQSTFKGRGMSFSEVRKYHYGDDIRNIDWNVTARTNDTYIKVFEEERELTVMLLLDVSGSSFYGTNVLKKDIITEISAVLAFSASTNNDKVGLILFSDTIELYIPPKKGKKHILRIIREIIDCDAKQSKTDIEQAIRYLSNVQKKKTISFLLSDFRTEGYKDALNFASKRHDLIGINLYDPSEKAIPNVGIIKAKDAETGKTVWLDTSSKTTREAYAKQFTEHLDYFNTAFLKSKADKMIIPTDEPYANALLQFFKQRHV